MYIHLDNSLDNLDLDNSQNLKNLGYLLDGFSEGYFIISGNRGLLEKLSKCHNLSKSAREAALFAYKNYATHQGFYNKIPFKVIITLENTEIDNISKKWIIDITKVKPGFLAQGVLILAENLNDSKFLNYSAEHFFIKNRKDFPLLKISNHFQGGGGDTITGELKNQLEKMQEFIFCFKDSDKYSPKCNLSNNANKCINLINKNSWLSFFSHTQCREAENLIPNSLLEKTPNIPYDKLEKLRILENKSNIHFYPYIDIKCGLTKKFYNNLGANSRKGKYWASVFDFLGQNDIIKNCEFDAKNNCKVHKQLADKNCVLLEASNEKTLDHVISFLNDISVHKSFEIIKNDPTNTEWLKIGETVFWLSCALPKLRFS